MIKIMQAIQDFLNKINVPGARVALAVRDLSTNETQKFFHACEDQYFYAASFIKLFAAYFCFKEHQGDDFFTELILPTIKTSLKDSDNDALSLLIDIASNTSSGPGLQPEAFKVFKQQRKSITDYFKKLGFSDGISLANKCFSFDAYGRDHQLVYGKDGLGSNLLTIDDAIKIMLLIYKQAPQLLEFMKRDLKDTSDEQTEFIGAGLKKDLAKTFYSKAAWTSKVRHDAAFIDFTSGKKLLVVMMTQGLSENKNFIPELTKITFS